MPMGMQVNVYALPGPGGVRLIDAGFDSDECREALISQLAGMDATLDQVHTVLLTHAHPDHIGLAAAITERSAATVLMHPAETPVAQGRGWRRAADWFRRNGLPPSEDNMLGEPAWRPRQVPPATPIQDGQVFRWAGLELEVILAPGHSPGLVCLLDRRKRVLFSSDQVLRRAVSPVGLATPAQGDPLGEHLASLKHIAGLDVELVLPGHGRPFRGLRARARSLIDYHQRRVETVLGHLPASGAGGATAFEVGTRALLDGSRSEDSAEARAWAGIQRLTQTLAILAHLERTGRACCADGDDRVVWLRA
jgi:glyoxylase-like metal-dependent hydrolase (beta-lactamase superfamily II)